MRKRNTRISHPNQYGLRRGGVNLLFLARSTWQQQGRFTNFDN